jgi:hypothetical protein
MKKACFDLRFLLQAKATTCKFKVSFYSFHFFFSPLPLRRAKEASRQRCEATLPGNSDEKLITRSDEMNWVNWKRWLPGVPEGQKRRESTAQTEKKQSPGKHDVQGKGKCSKGIHAFSCSNKKETHFEGQRIYTILVFSPFVFFKLIKKKNDREESIPRPFAPCGCDFGHLCLHHGFSGKPDQGTVHLWRVLPSIDWLPLNFS